MHDIDARKFQSASKTATLKTRETHGSVFLIALCNPVFRYTFFFYKNMFYKNIEADIREILRIF